MNNPPKAWQKLLCQAFQDTAIQTSPTGSCKLYHIRRFVYQALQHAGIQNRSPFSFLQLIKIHLTAKGNPQKVRSLCIYSVLNMTKPSFCLLSSSSYYILVTSILSLVALLTPITATTFKYQPTTQSILQIKILPWQDFEIDQVSLPLTSDYLIAAYRHEITEQEKQLETLNASSWILDQLDSAYSLQLLSVSNKTNLIEFCQKHHICEQSAFYTTQVKGKTIVRLIYGSYQNHNAAKLAKSELPASLQEISPWARSFKQIKSEL